MDPTNPTNDALVEQLWAAKAVSHADVYERILNTAKDTRKVRLTKMDDEIYIHFRNVFPDLNIEVFDYDGSKTSDQKEKWRKFIEEYDDEKVKDFNMATLMRLDGTKEFAPDNSCIVPRLQFHAIEIARNREGVNARRQVSTE